MPQPIHLFGYQGQTPQRLQQLIEALDACLLDIRYAARSRNPAWNKGALAARFGARYVHVPTLGNLNYKSGGSVAIADYAAGLRSIQRLGAPLVLLCVCADAGTCHRSVVGDLLRADGYSVVELDEQQQREILHSIPGQMSLWE